MTKCFTFGGKDHATPVLLVNTASYARLKKKLAPEQLQWLEQNDFSARSGQLCGLPSADGTLDKFLTGVANIEDPFAVADLPTRLPPGLYSLEGTGVKANFTSLAVGWGLGAYQFTRYKSPQNSPKREPAQLKIPNSANQQRIDEIVSATYRVRDMINTPAEDMMPQHIAATMAELAQTHEAIFTEIVGDELLAENYPCIHTVGRASINPPRLLELRWGDPAHASVTLIGKGISFDSGGLDIKPASGMRNMKKDMGGAAHAIGLAQLVMSLELPINLRLLVAAAENAISSNAFRPGDVITTRAGLTVEIDNTDAEGRLVLCDAITDACAEKPDLLVDFATLTGAARVAVGTEIAAYFCNSRELSSQLMQSSVQTVDPCWELPLHEGYANLLKSHVADTQNCASTPFGGATTAALYLQKFVDAKVPWLHFDIMAWNVRSRPGRPIGGEAMGLRAMFDTLEQRFRF